VKQAVFGPTNTTGEHYSAVPISGLIAQPTRKAAATRRRSAVHSAASAVNCVAASKLYVDVADTEPVQLMTLDERHDFLVGGDRRLRQVVQQPDDLVTLS
jgi:hypothetical protein